jgi:beta-lactamase class A
LRAQLERIAWAYPATYGVVIFDPSTGETLAMDADRRFLAASLNKLPVLVTLYWAAAGQVDLSTTRSPCKPPTRRLTTPASSSRTPSGAP